jgi:hypothetical protein
MKLNLINWLKRSPLIPKYTAAQKKDKVVGGSQVEKHIVHKFHHFYPSEWLDVPEFAFENLNDVIKRKDKEMLVQYLEKRELREKEKAAKKLEEANNAGEKAAAVPGKKDAKKDAGKAAPKAAKGAVVADDKNCP